MFESASTYVVSFNNFVASQEYSAALDVLAESESQLRNLPELSVRDRGLAMNTQLSLCASIRDACDFANSFERSFANRSALLDSKRASTNAAHWVITTFNLTLFAPSNVTSSALALKRLGSSLLGRSVIGRQRGIAVLLKAWRTYPSNLAIVEAIAVLCNGHVDNVSRFVREDGIDLCISILRSASTQYSMKEEIMLLLGLCCVCLPDEGKGDTLVDVVIDTLSEAANERSYSSKIIAAHALGCLANIGEAVVRDRYMTRETQQESLPGYAVGEPGKLIDAVLDAWEAWPQSWDVVSPAAWALVAMYRAKHVPQESWEKPAERMTQLWTVSKVESSSVCALRDIVPGIAQASTIVPDSGRKIHVHFSTPTRSKSVTKRKLPDRCCFSPVTPEKSSTSFAEAREGEDRFFDAPLTETSERNVRRRI